MKLSIREIKKDIKIATSVASLAIVLIGLIVGGFQGSFNTGIQGDATKQGKLQAAVPVSISDTDSLRDSAKPSAAREEAGSFAARIVRVVDGDTAVVVPENSEDAGNAAAITLRLIGINTPETVDPRRKVECFGKEASAKAKEILAAGTEVRIETDPTQDARDKYGRTLAYVFISSQPNAGHSSTSSGASGTDAAAELFFNKYMIEEGYAYEYTYDKAYLYQKEFKSAQKEAEAEERGLWSANTCNGNKAL